MKSVRLTGLLLLTACGNGTGPIPARTLLLHDDLAIPVYAYLFDASTNAGRRLGSIASGDSLCEHLAATDSLVFLAATAGPGLDTTTFLNSIAEQFHADSANAWDARLKTTSGITYFALKEAARCS